MSFHQVAASKKLSPPFRGPWQTVPKPCDQRIFKRRHPHNTLKFGMWIYRNIFLITVVRFSPYHSFWFVPVPTHNSESYDLAVKDSVSAANLWRCRSFCRKFELKWWFPQNRRFLAKKNRSWFSIFGRLQSFNNLAVALVLLKKLFCLQISPWSTLWGDFTSIRRPWNFQNLSKTKLSNRLNQNK